MIHTTLKVFDNNGFIQAYGHGYPFRKFGDYDNMAALMPLIFSDVAKKVLLGAAEV